MNVLSGFWLVGVLLTGMGQDGAEGLLELRRAGCPTIGQDEATSIVYGMPKVAWSIGAVQAQLPIEKIAAAILKASEPSATSQALAAAAEIGRVLAHDMRGLSRYALMFDLGADYDREAVLKATCAKMSAADARAFLYYIHFMFARHFVDPLARRNFIQEPVSVVRRFFGEGAVPLEARVDLGED